VLSSIPLLNLCRPGGRETAFGSLSRLMESRPGMPYRATPMRDALGSFIRRHGDELLAAILTALALLEFALAQGQETMRLVAAAFAIAAGAAAAVRSRAPLVLLGLMFALAIGALLFAPRTDSGALMAFLLLAVYSAAAHTSGRSTLVAAGMILGLLAANFVGDTSGISLATIVFYAMLVGVPWFAGRAVRQRRLKERQLENEKTKTAGAIAEERARIARELHDVVAHSISVMLLQARGGRRVLGSEPAEAREAFDTIERSGQQALDEMRRLLTMLRRSDEELALAPQPSLKQLDRLVEQVQGAGLPVEVRVEGEPRELPPSVDLSAYRIVQEALTNTLRHAGPAHATVLLRYGADDLEVEVSDDGTTTGKGTGIGYGLVGMRERVSVYGGEFHAGRTPGGGYALRARLPTSPARA
jgi:signal transduction histidine kinase